MLVHDDTETVDKLRVYDQGVQFDDSAVFGVSSPACAYRTGDVVRPKLDDAEPLRLEVGHFLECVRTGRAPRTGARAGLRVVRAVEAAERALRSGRPVSLEPERW